MYFKQIKKHFDYNNFVKQIFSQQIYDTKNCNVIIRLKKVFFYLLSFLVYTWIFMFLTNKLNVLNSKYSKLL